jgi:hypothetical protein
LRNSCIGMMSTPKRRRRENHGYWIDPILYLNLGCCHGRTCESDMICMAHTSPPDIESPRRASETHASPILSIHRRLKLTAILRLTQPPQHTQCTRRTMTLQPSTHTFARQIKRLIAVIFIIPFREIILQHRNIRLLRADMLQRDQDAGKTEIYLIG